MCCDLSTHVKVIAIICIIFTGLGSLRLIGTIQHLVDGTTSKEIAFVFSGNAALALGIQILVYTMWIASEVSCLIGATKNNKCLLIPFMICQCLAILVCSGLVMLIIYLGVAWISWIFLLIIPLLIPLGLSTYFLAIVSKFYNELSLGIISGQEGAIVVKPYNSSQAVPEGGGVSTLYVPPATQNVIYAY